MSAKYGDDRDPYLYPTLDVLRNRLGIRQAQRLEQTAWEFTSLRAATIPLGPRGRGLPHLCADSPGNFIRISLTGRANCG